MCGVELVCYLYTVALRLLRRAPRAIMTQLYRFDCCRRVRIKDEMYSRSESSKNLLVHAVLVAIKINSPSCKGGRGKEDDDGVHNVRDGQSMPRDS